VVRCGYQCAGLCIGLLLGLGGSAWVCSLHGCCLLLDTEQAEGLFPDRLCTFCCPSCSHPGPSPLPNKPAPQPCHPSSPSCAHPCPVLADARGDLKTPCVAPRAAHCHPPTPETPKPC
jgi:hypothetical protein